VLHKTNAEFFHFCVARFRIKIGHLVEEAKMIKQAERTAVKRWKVRRSGRHWEQVVKDGAKLDCPDRMSYAQQQLWLHRIDVVRPEIRAAFLAYAMFRGKSYKSVEGKTFKRVDVRAVHRVLNSMTKRYPRSDMVYLLAEVQDWVDGAQAPAAAKAA
jgi:hypothetical protein